MTERRGPENTGEQRIFATTRWSLVISGGKLEGDEAAARAALSELCRIYWRPIFAYVCRRGYSKEDAQDFTQDFFLMILEDNWLRHADESRGRFRSLLLKSLQHFLGHAEDRRRALKRGGQVHFISWDEFMAEAPSSFSLCRDSAEAMEPEHLFDLRWAATVVEQAMRRLQEECETGGKRRLYDVLSSHLVGERADVSYAQLALTLRIAETAVKKQLHLLRQRYRTLLREEVAHTVSDPADVDEEIRYLCAALAATAE
ncbi:MAG: sigma-70 family RNA polymerase sigma factor [Chthoniobacterales bacterium]